jgi:hypothetical protein
VSRSFARLRRALLGVSCTVVFGFGAPQAFAKPNPEPEPGPVACLTTSDQGQPYYTFYCAQGCVEQVGYCDGDGFCRCGYIP